MSNPVDKGGYQIEPPLVDNSTQKVSNPIPLDKELEKILDTYADGVDAEVNKVAFNQAIAQIKSTILEAIEREMPKDSTDPIDSRAECYNKGKADCLEVVRKTLQ